MPRRGTARALDRLLGTGQWGLFDEGPGHVGHTATIVARTAAATASRDQGIGRLAARLGCSYSIVKR